jgi:hypothetical protein
MTKSPGMPGLFSGVAGMMSGYEITNAGLISR